MASRVRYSPAYLHLPRKKQNKRFLIDDVPHRKEPRDRRLYLVQFVLRDNTRETFVKVGVSGTSIEQRFFGDVNRYEIKTLVTSVWLKEKDAFALEGAFHATFAAHSYRPLVPLCSGNTECYRMPDDVLQAAVTMAAKQKERRVSDSAGRQNELIGGGIKPRKGGGFYRQPVGKGKKPPNRHGTKRRYQDGCRCRKCTRTYQDWLIYKRRVEGIFDDHGAGARAQETPAKFPRRVRSPDAPPLRL